MSDLKLFEGLLVDLSNGKIVCYDNIVRITFEFEGYTVVLTIFKVEKYDLIVKGFISIELAIEGVPEWHYSPNIRDLEATLPKCAINLRGKLLPYGIRISRNV